jgi:hypothetical protein
MPQLSQQQKTNDLTTEEYCEDEDEQKTEEIMATNKQMTEWTGSDEETGLGDRTSVLSSEILKGTPRQ